MTDVVRVDLVKYGRFARDEPGLWSVPTEQSLGITSRSESLQREESHALLPAQLLEIGQLHPNMVDPAAARAGFFVAHAVPRKGKTALIRSRFRPDDGEGGNGRLYQQTSIWRIDSAHWHNFPGLILKAAQRELKADPDVLPAKEDRFRLKQKPIPIDLREAESLGDALANPLVLRILDLLLPIRPGLPNTSATLVVGGTEDGAINEEAFLNAAGRALEILSACDIGDRDDISIVSGLKHDLSGRCVAFLPSEKAAERPPIDRGAIEGRLKRCLIKAGRPTAAMNFSTAPKLPQPIASPKPDRNQVGLTGPPQFRPSEANLGAAPQTSARRATSPWTENFVSSPEGAGRRSLYNSHLSGFAGALDEFRIARQDPPGNRYDELAFRVIDAAHVRVKSGAHDDRRGVGSTDGLDSVAKAFCRLYEGRIGELSLGALFDLLKFHEGLNDEQLRSQWLKLRAEFVRRVSAMGVLLPGELNALELPENSDLRADLQNAARGFRDRLTSSLELRMWSEDHAKTHGAPSYPLNPQVALGLGEAGARLSEIVAGLNRSEGRDPGVDITARTGCYVTLETFTPAQSLLQDVTKLAAAACFALGQSRNGAALNRPPAPEWVRR